MSASLRNKAVLCETHFRYGIAGTIAFAFQSKMFPRRRSNINMEVRT